MTRRTSITKLVLFDLDGTLADSLLVGLEEMNRLRFLFGYPKLDRNDPRLRETTGMDFAQNILKLNTLQLLAWMFLLKKLVSRRAHEIPVYDGWNTTLKCLKKKYRIGVVTSAPHSYARTILSNASLPGFDVFSADTKYHRKDAVFQKILAEENLSPEDTVYVGDELRDFEASQKIGIPFVAVNWGKDHEKVFAPFRKKIRTILQQPADLLKVI